MMWNDSEDDDIEYACGLRPATTIVNPLNRDISIRILQSYCSPCISCGTHEENLLNNQDLFLLLIISFFFSLTAFIFD